MAATSQAAAKAQRAALVDDRRAKVAHYKVRGYSIRQTMAALASDGVTNPATGKPWGIRVIDEDVQFMRAQWRASAQRDIAEWHADELQQIAEREREAWNGWLRSVGRKERTLTERRTGSKSTPPGDGERGRAEAVDISTDRTSIQAEELAGDPRFLSALAECHRDRSRLLEFGSPKRVELTGLGGGPVAVKAEGPDLSRLSVDQLRQYRELLLAAGGGAAEEEVASGAPSDEPPRPAAEDKGEG